MCYYGLLIGRRRSSGTLVDRFHQQRSTTFNFSCKGQALKGYEISVTTFKYTLLFSQLNMFGADGVHFFIAGLHICLPRVTAGRPFTALYFDDHAKVGLILKSQPATPSTLRQLDVLRYPETESLWEEKRSKRIRLLGGTQNEPHQKIPASKCFLFPPNSPSVFCLTFCISIYVAAQVKIYLSRSHW